MRQRGLGFGRAVVFGALVGLVAVLGAAVLVAVRADEAAEVSELLVVLAVGDEQGVHSGVVVADVGLEPQRVRLIDPTRESRLVGVAYSRIGEAYPFGGGSAVLEAARGAGLTKARAAVGIDEDVWTKAVDAAGGLTVRIPEDVNAFVGGRLQRFVEGTETVSGRRAAALIVASRYVTDPVERRELREAVSIGALRAVGGIDRSGATGPSVQSSVRQSVLWRLWPDLSVALRRARVEVDQD